jgi:hypothetical protein
VETLQRVGLAPIGMAETDCVFTKHIEVPDPAAQREAVVQKIDLVEPAAEHPAQEPELEDRIDRVLASIASSSAETSPQLPFVEAVPPVSTEETAAPSVSVFADLDSVAVEVGDLVFIRYDDQPERTFSVRLSDTITDRTRVLSMSNGSLGCRHPRRISGRAADRQDRRSGPHSRGRED